ncbi:MAG: hypothetical protein QM723_10555 [Myxococcaceae bacterium]
MTPLLAALVLAATPPSQQSLAESEVVVRGEVTRLEAVTVTNAQAAHWQRATVKVKRMLKGVDQPELTFIFAGSTAKDFAAMPKAKVGQEAIWLLLRGPARGPHLQLISAEQVQPVTAEAAIARQLAALDCPAHEGKTCKLTGEVCGSAETICSCDRPCQGGAYNPNIDQMPSTWRCQPAACTSAEAGAACPKEGLACNVCFGAAFSCQAGKWVEHRLSPPP